eukprot:571882-Pleurochrysis_carterae.AAC.1
MVARRRARELGVQVEELKMRFALVGSEVARRVRDNLAFHTKLLNEKISQMEAALKSVKHATWSQKREDELRSVRSELADFRASEAATAAMLQAAETKVVLLTRNNSKVAQALTDLTKGQENAR